METEIVPGDYYHDPEEHQPIEVVSIFRSRQADTVSFRTAGLSSQEPISIKRSYFLRLFKKGLASVKC